MLRAVFFVALSAILAAAFFWRPAGGPDICSSKRLLGISCPGCGVARSVTAFAQGRIAESIEYHLFGPLVMAVAVTLWGLALYGLFRRRDFRTPSTPAFNGSLTVALVMLLGYWLARMATGTTP